MRRLAVVERLLSSLCGHTWCVIGLDAATAVLWCARCDQRRPALSLLPRESSLSEQATAVGVRLVDRAALEQLLLAHQVNGVYADALRDRLRGEL